LSTLFVIKEAEMKKSKGLALPIAGAFAAAILFGTSAFAESRHQHGTGGSSRGSSQGFSRGFSRGFSGGSPRGFSGGSSRGFSGSSPRGFSRGFSGGSPRGFSRPSSGHTTVRAPRSFGSRGVGTPRPSGRIAPSWHGAPRSFGRSVPFRGPNFYNSGRHFFGRGRIDRIVPFNGGYRVWLGGWGCPFFVPYRFYNPFRFRVGLFVGFNAFYDPLGYYNVYGGPPVYSGAYDRYDDRYNDRYNDRYSDSVLRGIVESVDIQSGHVVINDESSRRTVRALLPPRDRRVDEIRPGDYVEFSGTWVRGRSYDFDANTMDRFEPKR